MPLARAYAVALLGVQGHLVEVEADLAPGLPGVTLIGLPDAALSEARDRVRAAILNSGESWPSRRITLNLSPAALPKRGSGFDLALAAAILAAAGSVPAGRLAGAMLHGELGLDGRVRPVRGVLPAVLAATAVGVSHVVVPAGNAEEAALVPGATVTGVRSLQELVCRLRGVPVPEEALTPRPEPPPPTGAEVAPPDLADVLGQVEGRQALEIAAAGGHHLFLLGPPGAGKTMLAERLPGLLPALDRDSALEVTAIHSVAGTLPPGCPLVTRAPFCNPHHTASVAALVGGGSNLARPGAVSLAHRGVLFLDEAPEFHGGVLDALRQPLEAGEITIARAGGSVRFPARFTLVLAANPCPCAAAGTTGADCICTSAARRRYLARLSGPLLDRVDLQVTLLPVGRAEMLADRGLTEPTPRVAARVAAARDRARARLAGTPWQTMAEVPGRELRGRFALPRAAMRPVESQLDRGALTARGVDRVLRVAWTLADLGERPAPGADEVAHALSLRRAA